MLQLKKKDKKGPSESVFFVVLRPSVDWKQVTHVREDNLFYSGY